MKFGLIFSVLLVLVGLNYAQVSILVNIHYNGHHSESMREFLKREMFQVMILHSYSFGQISAKVSLFFLVFYRRCTRKGLF